MSYSVVIKVFCSNCYRWGDIVDSSTRSGASRKALGLLKDALITKEQIKEKTRVDNYEYWRVED